jgi:hypothetical protein
MPESSFGAVHSLRYVDRYCSAVMGRLLYYPDVQGLRADTEEMICQPAKAVTPSARPYPFGSNINEILYNRRRR